MIGLGAVPAAAVVTGPGSTWNAGGDLNIGLPFGTGTVTIADGGVLNVAGTANIGAGSTLNVGTGGLAGTLNAPTISTTARSSRTSPTHPRWRPPSPAPAP